MMRRSGLLFLLLGLVLGSLPSALAQSPELSSDDPITYDANERVLVARGNARFAHQEAIVEANEIRYDEQKRQILARGNVRVTQAGIRLVTHELEYFLDTRAFASGPFRVGTPPIFIEGQSFRGTLDEITLEDGQVFFREPERGNPSLSFGTAVVRDRSRVSADSVALGLPFLGKIPLPDSERPLNASAPLQASGNGGYRGNLGAYVRTEILFPLDDAWLLGGNLDLYSRRGVLLGPSARFLEETDERYLAFELSSGWIADQSKTRGVDRLGEAVDRDRAFLGMSFRYEAMDLELAGTTLYQTDSEILRDFRSDIFSRQPSPDSFLELTQLWEDRFFSVFIRRSWNQFYGLVEQLPEFRFDQPARRLGETPIFHSADASYSIYRATGLNGIPGLTTPPLPFDRDSETFFDALFDESAPPGYEKRPWNHRVDANYVLQAPQTIRPGVQFTPRAAARYTFWNPEDSGSAARLAGEFGFDLRAEAARTYDYRNTVWGIDGLRHRLRPSLAYRWQPVTTDGTLADLERYERRTYSPLLPALDLRDRRDVDVLDARHLLRFGLEQALLTRDGPEGSRTLAEVDLYQDLYFDLTDDGRAAHATYLELRTAPARWLELSFAQKYRTDALLLEESRLRTTIRSADAWELSLSFDFLRDLYDQYQVEGWYRLTSRFTTFGGVRFDADRNELTRQVYGLRHRVSRSWELEYAVVLRRGAAREDDFSLRLGLQLVRF